MSRLSAEYELRFLRAGAEALEAYLLSAEHSWPITARSPTGSRPYPPLTLGALLLARQKAMALASPQAAPLLELNSEIEKIRSRWQAAWARKAALEFPVRLKLWRNFLLEYRQEPDVHADRYAYEVERRVQLELLDREMSASLPAEMTLLASLDSLLKNKLIPGEFIWDIAFAQVFPETPFWYLYGHLRGD